ncbi:YciI family protein [Nakamurella endophytica]|uniref:YCII-related domain-containing protein n=1 Tax=Nakamurella endophytica TaxID=1748367 RepID=A0A917SXP6_9ACTN|nr:YciI family protein [Nakamurella endophytica]GGM01458.1 hypothetical protein GCM10011594_21890 [Nakamurella endophytica]
MTKYLLAVDFRSGDDETPMSEWTPAEIDAHLAHYDRLHDELVASGELVDSVVLTGPDRGLVVRSDGRHTGVQDGPFQEFKEWIAGFQIVDVASQERAVEIAARVSAVPGRGGRPTRQPIQVRPLLERAPSDAGEMAGFLDQVTERS